MTYEELLNECDDRIIVEERNMINEGLYADGFVWIRKELPQCRKKCILAEEMGHHFLTVGDITNQTSIDNQKQEHKARVWAYNKLLSVEKIIDAASKGYTQPYDMAEYLDVDEEFLRDFLKYQGIVNIY